MRRNSRPFRRGVTRYLGAANMHSDYMAANVILTKDISRVHRPKSPSGAVIEAAERRSGVPPLNILEATGAAITLWGGHTLPKAYPPGSIIRVVSDSSGEGCDWYTTLCLRPSSPKSEGQVSNIYEAYTTTETETGLNNKWRCP